MTNNSQRNLVTDGRDRMGCMWVFISMFDSRNSGSTQKLLAVRERGSRRIPVSINLGNKLEKPTCSNENCPEFIDAGDTNATSDIGKLSVKKLIEEDMFSEQEIKKETSIEKAEKISDSDFERLKKKIQKRKKKTCSVETKGFNDSDHQIVSSNESSEVNFQLNQTNDKYKEKMNELVKLLMNQKNDEILGCKNTLEACQFLGSDHESFQKLLHELETLLPKDVQHLPNSQTVEEEKPKSSVEGSILSEQGVSPLADVTRKKRSFFRRKAKSQERTSSTENGSSQVSNAIVILQPGRTILNAGSSSATCSTQQNERRDEKSGSRFSINGLKRKLKSATRKNQRGVPCDQIRNSNNKEINQNVGRTASNKDKKMAQASTSREKGEETQKSEKAKQNVSMIYIEAKKHLSEMLRDGDVDANLSSDRVPSILGRILALPEYFTPGGSPQRIQEHGSVDVIENKQEYNLSPLGLSAKQPKNQKRDSDVGCDNARKHLEVKTGSKNRADEINSGGGLETVKEAEMLEQENITMLGTFSEPRISFNTESDPKDDDAKAMHDERTDNDISRQEKCDENRSPTSQLSPSNSSIRRVECHESATDFPGKSSPVSVLEPLFTEDDISPTSTRPHSFEIRLQPLYIQFGEPNSSETDQDSHKITTMDDKDSTFEYIKAVLKASNLNWQELYTKSFSLDRLLDPSFIDGVDFFQNHLCSDKNLLFDCINEVLMEFCGYESGSCPWILFVKHKVQEISNMERVIHEVQKGVYWHLLPVPLPHTLDQIVRKDMAKRGRWTDLRYEVGCIGTETSEVILDELLEETIINGVNSRLDLKSSLVLAESKEEHEQIILNV